MNAMDAIKTRKSVRSYLAKPVEDQKLNAVLEAARLVPSAYNRQEWRLVVVRERESRKKLADVARGQAFVNEAPVVIVACAETDGHVMRCGQLCYPIDGAIALYHMSLAAVDLGLGSCVIGRFDEQGVKKILNIADEIRGGLPMTLGDPSDPSPIEKIWIAFD